MNFAIAIHGGAGNINRKNYSPEQIREYEAKLAESLQAGFDILEKGGTAIDATVASVTVMEDSPLFNAGVGGVFADNAMVELDACIMDGKTLNAGGITTVHKIKNPIEGALRVMEDSPHTLLSGNGAELFVYQKGLKLVPNKYFHTKKRYEQFKKAQEKQKIMVDHSMGTVGAVAIDLSGNLAAATSTGGMTNKAFGRVSDTSIVGAGNYANNNTCAISGTGTGDQFIKSVFAHDVSSQMEYGRKSLEEAGKSSLKKLASLGGHGGFVAIDHRGSIHIDFNSTGMFRGFKNKSETFIAIF
ncbi:MAG: isoaspartyl peptidase/L-asparaginase [Deltaproteobacteria bacterium]|nr:MAG: isoaspartyl peptidase/L-asparaginase [Deltaproteobacteria bacterium]